MTHYPNRVCDHVTEFEYDGRRCRLLSHKYVGFYLGYVESSLTYGFAQLMDVISDLDGEAHIHGGLTYAEPDDERSTMWYGLDWGRYNDLCVDAEGKPLNELISEDQLVTSSDPIRWDPDRCCEHLREVAELLSRIEQMEADDE